MDVQFGVRIVQAHIRTLPCFLTEIVSDGILHLVSHEHRVMERITEYHRVNSESGFYIHVFIPFHCLHGIVHLLSIVCSKAYDGLKNTDGCAEAEIGLVKQSFVTCEAHHASPYLNIIGSQIGKLFCQYLLQSLEGLGNHFKGFSHLDYIA